MAANRELDWPEFLKLLAKNARSERGKELCLSIGPLETEIIAAEKTSEILGAQSLLIDNISPDFSILDQIPPLLNRLSIFAVLDVKELCQLRIFLESAIAFKVFLKQTKNSWTENQLTALADFKPQVSAINHVLAPNGEINEDASQTLLSLSQEQRTLSLQISRLLDQIIAKRQMESVLQDKYVTNREGRMVIPVKSGNQHDIKGLIHDASQSKQTVFMEPEEAIPLNNRLREVQIQIQEEIERILRELSQYLTRFLTSFQNADRVLLESETTLAKAAFNKIISGNCAAFSQDRIHLKNLRHPLLVAQGVRVVPNTVTLDNKNRILLLSGPNAGGKTILLKSLGLAAQMARCGMPIPADEGSEIPFFKVIDPVIGDLQAVSENLSSFSSHMVRLKDSLPFKGLKNLVLVDEICGATDPEEGAALARSFIEHYADQDIFAVVTSHLGPLKEGWGERSQILHGSLEFDTQTNRPTFQLLLGFPGRSLALAVAERLGIPKDIVQRAKSHLTPHSQSRAKELHEIENLKEKILELKKQTTEDAEVARNAKKQYLELVQKFRDQRDRWLDKALEKAQKKIENLIEDARLDRLKNKTLHDIKSELPEIIKSRPNTQKIQTLEEFKNLFKPGTPAFSTRLGREVIVQSEPDHKGQVLVLADSMRVQIPWHGLSSQAPKDEVPQQVVRRSANSKPVSDDFGANELDLRGHRVDEALTVLEKWLDGCIRESQDRVKVIHGFGTEQLKKSIRQFLSKSPYVARWAAGEKLTGGDGVTWITLSD